MGLSKEEIETLLKKEEAELEKQLKAKDPAAIAQLYHPDAVLVHRGVKTSYGREEIKKAYEPFMHMDPDSFQIKPTYAVEADNGEYLIRRGTYTVTGNPKTFEYEQIYKKVGGKYLIYHDEFTFEA